MSAAYAYALSVYPQMYGIDKPAPKKSKAKINFTELVRPDGYWPQPYSLEQAFQTYRWMIRTGRGFSTSGYGVYDQLDGNGARGNHDLHYSPITSIDALRKRFAYAILGRSNGPNTTAWRKQEKVQFGEERILHFPHYAPFTGAPLLGNVLSEAQISKVLQAYFAAEGNLRVQLNESHAAAVEIVKLKINVGTWDFKFRFLLDYGYDGSWWTHVLAEGEQFIDALGEAIKEFGRVSGQDLLQSISRH